MGHLIKYEWKKQKTSRMIILILLAVFILAMIVGEVTNSEGLVGASLMTMMFATMFVIFYTSLECLIVFNRDLRTKQSYMLWMLPMSTWKILGAKFLAAIVQIMFVAVSYVTAFLVLISVEYAIDGRIGEFLADTKQLIEQIRDVSINWGDVALVFGVLFLVWLIVVMTGFLAIIISRTVFLKSRFAGLFSVITFFVINFVIEKLYGLCLGICGMGYEDTFYRTSGQIPIFDFAFYIAIGFLLFVISGWLAQRKLSV